MSTEFSGLSDIARITDGRTRSISAENPTGAKGVGAQASPGDDAHCSDASREMGRGWKVRPCLKNIEPGQTLTIADIEGPGVVQHIWCTVLHSLHRWIVLRVYYDGCAEPAICVPLGDFFTNGVDGSALVNSVPIAVNPRGGMNSYWPMPFRGRIRFEITNDGPEPIPEFFYQITYAEQAVADDAGYLHAMWRRSTTTRDNPEHVILDGVQGKGQYVGTYLVWNQFSTGWWGEGEVKFFIDGDEPDRPTICGTGTEDYFGGAWGFVMDDNARTDTQTDPRPTTYSTAYLGYPQAVFDDEVGGAGNGAGNGARIASHGLYRWHIPDPIRFASDLRVTVQALGWWPNSTYQPLTEDIASTALWYQSHARARNLSSG
jgi:D-arabinan exo alpha-(1,3)/(1,5)-arabinofuranosidase (non-reducing end)